jgi:putative acetyltransferase
MLRRAGKSHVKAIAEVFAASRDEAMPWLPVLHTPEEDHAFFAAVVREQEVWVSVVDNRVAGFAAIAEGFLNHMYVHPDFQERGIGDALFARAKRSCPHGFRLWVFQQNERARRFYERRGAIVVELTDGSGNEEQTPDALYEWRPTSLPSPARARAASDRGSSGRSRAVGSRSSPRRSR